MEIIIEKKNTAKKAGEELSKALHAHRGKEVLLMLSGGSAFDVLQYIDAKEITEKITISVVDERFSMDPEVNNFCQLEQTSFFDTCIEKGCAIIGTRIHKTETLPKAVMNFGAELRRWRKSHPKGAVITLLGIGEDGHTAGVMPFPESARLFSDLFLDEEWVAGFDATGKNEHTLRFTTTLTFIKEETSAVIVYAQGKKKKKALNRMTDMQTPVHEVPARVLQDIDNVTLVTDQELTNA